MMRNLNLEDNEARRIVSLWTLKKPATESFGDSSELDEDTKQKVLKVETTVGHFLSQLVIEVQRSIDAFCIMYGVDSVDDLYLCGSGVLYPGLVSHIQKTLGIETRVFNPFARMLEKERQTEEVVERAPLYAVAVGLALP